MSRAGSRAASDLPVLRHNSVHAEEESKAMKFGLHHSSWDDSPVPAEAYEAVKAKAHLAEEHGCVLVSVMDHMIQIHRVGTPDEPVMEGWNVLAVVAAVTTRLSL